MKPLRNLYEKIQFSFTVVREVFREYLYENTGLKLFALLIAIVLWAAVSKQEMVQTTLQEVPIEYTNLPSGLAIANEDGLKFANVRLRGLKDVLEPLRPDNLTIKINLATTKPGERAVTLSRADVIAPPNVEVVDVEPQRTHLTIEPIIERQVKVVPRFGNNIPQDYEVTSFSANPGEVTISGPESHVNAVADAPTETISLSEHRTSFVERPNIDIKDAKINILNTPVIEVQVQVGQIRIERRIANVPLRVMPNTDNLSLSAVSVAAELEGPKSIIENLTSADISAVIDTENVPDTATVTPRILLPPSAIGLVTIKKVEPEQIVIKRHR